MGRVYWRVCAALALLLAAAYVARPLWAPSGSAAAPYVEAGGGDNNLISFAGVDERAGKIFVVDTQAKVILVYEASQYAFKLAAARVWASDSAASRAIELPYNQRGYSVPETEAYAKRAQ